MSIKPGPPDPDSGFQDRSIEQVPDHVATASPNVHTESTSGVATDSESDGQRDEEITRDQETDPRDSKSYALYLRPKSAGGVHLPSGNSVATVDLQLQDQAATISELKAQKESLEDENNDLRQKVDEVEWKLQQNSWGLNSMLEVQSRENSQLKKEKQKLEIVIATKEQKIQNLTVQLDEMLSLNSSGGARVAPVYDAYFDPGKYSKELGIRPHNEEPSAKVVITVGGRLGRSGGYGKVSKMQMPNKKLYAMKEFYDHVVECLGKEKFEELLRREIEIMKKCEHKNIIKYYGCCTVPALNSIGPVLLMEIMELDFQKYYCEKLRDVDTIPALRRVIEVLIQVADGLDYLHNPNPGLEGVCERIVHRDLTATNVLLAGSNGFMIAKISDFGLSRFIKCSQKSSIMMTPLNATEYYLAPEIDKRLVMDACGSPKVDIFSFGHLALASSVQEVIDGLPGPTKFVGDNEVVVTEIERRQKYFEQLLFKIGVNHPLTELIKCCLIKRPPQDRPSAKEISRKLQSMMTTHFS